MCTLLTSFSLIVFRTRRGLRSGEISVSGDSWPIFLYQNSQFNIDNPWDGLLQGTLLVTVSTTTYPQIYHVLTHNPKAFKYVFTSPSSIEKETRATRSGNAELHGMKCVTVASIAYISTLVRTFQARSIHLSVNKMTTRFDSHSALVLYSVGMTSLQTLNAFTSPSWIS